MNREMENVKKDEETHKGETIEKLIVSEAKVREVEREIKETNKKMKKINDSNTWRVSRPFRTLSSFIQTLFGRNSLNEFKKLNEQLKRKLETTEEELFETREQLYEQMVDNQHMESNILPIVKELKDNGSIIRYIDKVIQQKKMHENNYNQVLKYAARVFMNEKPEYKDYIYLKVLEGLKIEDVPEFIIRAGLEENNIPLDGVSSFRACLNIRMRQKQLGDITPEWLLDDKKIAYDFVDKLKIRKPWVSVENYTIDEIPNKEGIVIKPADGAGSRGVYLVYGPNNIFDVKRSKSLDNWEDLKENMRNDLSTKWVEKDDWIIEELIYLDKNKQIPANDVKFYCFYGKVGLILEIERFPELKYCWWTANGERIKTGKYQDQPFIGTGVTQEELNMVSKLSFEIPAPFSRIDFLRSGEELVFGEFTPKPGNYDEFDEATDRWLGDLYIEAQARLNNDLINGKDFTLFKDFRNSVYNS